MISAAEVQTLHDRDSEELRSLAAHIAGVLAHRHGVRAVATAYARIGRALTGAADDTTRGLDA